MTDLNSKDSTMKERLKDFVDDRILEAADDFEGERTAEINQRSKADPNQKSSKTGLMWAARIKKLKVVRNGGKKIIGPPVQQQFSSFLFTKY